MKKYKAIGFVALLTIIMIIVGVLYFRGKEFVIRISESELKNKISEKLPYSKTYLFIIEITLSNPRIDLISGSDIINAGLDVVLNIRVNNEEMNLGGCVDLSGNIKFNSDSGEFFLNDPIVEKLNIQGIPERYLENANKAIGFVISRQSHSTPR